MVINKKVLDEMSGLIQEVYDFTVSKRLLPWELMSTTLEALDQDFINTHGQREQVESLKGTENLWRQQNL